MTVTIDYAAPTDAAGLEALFRAVVEPLDIYNEAARAHQLSVNTATEFEQRLARDPASVVVARRAGELAGFAVVEEQQGPVWIDWYGVSPARRGLGIGDRLIGFVVAESRRRGATRVWCDTRTVNAASNAVLEKHGFRRLCVLPNHWYGQDFILWDLSPLQGVPAAPAYFNG